MKPDKEPDKEDKEAKRQQRRRYYQQLRKLAKEVVAFFFGRGPKPPCLHIQHIYDPPKRTTHTFDAANRLTSVREFREFP